MNWIRFQDEKDPQVENILQQFGFVRGVGYLQSFAKEGDQDYLVRAAKAFGFFAEQFPTDPKAVMAMQKEPIACGPFMNGRKPLASLRPFWTKINPIGSKFLSVVNC